MPMFAVSSLLMAIDSLIFAFAGRVRRLPVHGGGWKEVQNSKAKLETRNSPACGFSCGFCCAAGMLFKPVLVALPVCALVGAYFDVRMRRAVWSWHGLGALLLVAASQIPVVIWNAGHGWVTFLHIGAQGRLTRGRGRERGAHRGPLKEVWEIFGRAGGRHGRGIIVLLAIAVSGGL